MSTQSFSLKALAARLNPRMNPKNQRRVTDEEALEQTRRNRLRAAMLESRGGTRAAGRCLEKTLDA